jgi:type II secretory pathway pseudopilin PulG
LVIIAILAGILLPVFARVREGARTASCASNLKQLGMAFMQYTADHNQRYPGGAITSTGITAVTGSRSEQQSSGGK